MYIKIVYNLGYGEEANDCESWSDQRSVSYMKVYMSGSVSWNGIRWSFYILINGSCEVRVKLFAYFAILGHGEAVIRSASTSAAAISYHSSVTSPRRPLPHQHARCIRLQTDVSRGGLRWCIGFAHYGRPLIGGDTR